MVLRCSLLGHDYGDSEVEREREERGSEVVVTVQEYEECTRCGERHVISENTEVTSLSAGASGDSLPDDPEPTADSDAPSQSNHSAQSHSSTAADNADAAAGEGVEFIDADADAGDGGDDPAQPAATADANADASAETADPAADADGDGDPDLPTDENGDPVTDDGEIIEDTLDEAADRDRGRGEWPDTDDVGPPVSDDEPTAWPDADGAGDDPAEDDAVILEHDSTTAAAADGDTGAAVDAGSTMSDIETTVSDISGAEIETGAAVDADSATEADPDLEPDTGIERAGAAPTPADDTGPEEDGVPTEFYCPRCDFVASDERASLRAGDICPDCRKGYLGERPRR